MPRQHLALPKLVMQVTPEGLASLHGSIGTNKRYTPVESIDEEGCLCLHLDCCPGQCSARFEFGKWALARKPCSKAIQAV